MIQLEKYHGTRSRHTCPACNSRNCFVRYVGKNGDYISFDVGRCNRESKCGYHYKPKQFFADNPQIKTNRNYKQTNIKTRVNSGLSNPEFANKEQSASLQKENRPDFIPFESFIPTLANYDKNNFVQFLLDLFPDCSDEVQDVLKMYFVGTYVDYGGNYTCFPSIDRQQRICRAKLIRFNRESGKRLKGQFDTSSLRSKLKLKKDFNYKQIFFGEHLLRKYPDKPVAVVEAEKTAIIASLCLPEFIWLGCNSKTWLKTERLKRLGNRQIILYPDADGFDLWESIATDAKQHGLNVKVSNLIENRATDEHKANGYDLADYLISQQTEINNFNAKLERVLNDEKLYQDFETIIEERISILEFDGKLSRADAETIANAPEFIRQTILCLF